MSEFFVGIVPPEPYLKQVVSFQQRWSSNRLPDMVEPHITVKAQGGLTWDMGWLGRCKEVCQAIPPFELAITAPLSFGDEVVFLGVHSSRILELHRQLVHAVSPSIEQLEQYFELDRYVPHMTLGQTHWGMTQSELAAMKSEAGKALSPYPAFTVTHLRVYQLEANHSYVPFEDILLKENGMNRNNK
ncbi:2'-5' RNA ligase family protein [Paenibacillus sp. H1-7]|uniref:2'-5' RNA ligase family protein n=1 Tax=Paenibacillus sp. H1-7 TaxID=2282849 RepID=UPI001EF7AD91|nr:2'-5' RNA ligase family protein [Paenibacillus sp. H1-7]ULL15912.1 2'-5' RNA ligase family protein [Paenibacillus sp. H1-7]